MNEFGIAAPLSGLGNMQVINGDNLIALKSFIAVSIYTLKIVTPFDIVNKFFQQDGKSIDSQNVVNDNTFQPPTYNQATTVKVTIYTYKSEMTWTLL